MAVLIPDKDRLLCVRNTLLFKVKNAAGKNLERVTTSTADGAPLLHNLFIAKQENKRPSLHLVVVVL